MRNRFRFLLLAGACIFLSQGGMAAPAGQPNWRQEFAAFLSLPSEKQERVRKLDRKLQDEDPENQVVLYRVMQRYADWLERLPIEKRKAIEGAKSNEEKLRLIREIREEQWIATLPKTDRDHIQAAPSAEEKRKRVAAVRKRAYDREVEWLFAQARVGEPPGALVEEIGRLRQQLNKKDLSAKDAQQLRELQGKGPAYLKLLVDLCQKYDVPVSEVFRKLWAEQEANPPVNRQKLLQFFMSRLSESERRFFDERFRDPEQQEQARQELEKRYWQEHPEELQRVRELVKRKNKPRPGKPGSNP